MASIRSQKGRLYLSATLPHKDGSPGRKQQVITLKLDHTAQNWRIAEKRLKMLEREIDRGTFEWSDWLDDHGKVSWRHAIDLLYRKKVINGRTSQSTWDVRVMGYLRQLDPSEQVTTQSVQRFVTRYTREQASYKQAFYIFKDLAKLADVPFPELGTPLYGKSELMEVPTDAEIVEWVLTAGQPYQWAFGTIATFGLRPSELAGCEFDGDRLLVPENTKTGARIVVPLYKEWVKKFDLRNVQELPKSERYEPRPDEIAQYLHKRKTKMGIKFKTYSLRHAYCGRLWRTGGSKLDVYLAARLLGHSVAEHTKTYRRFISPHTIAERAEDVLYT